MLYQNGDFMVFNEREIYDNIKHVYIRALGNWSPTTYLEKNLSTGEVTLIDDSLYLLNDFASVDDLYTAIENLYTQLNNNFAAYTPQSINIQNLYSGYVTVYNTSPEAVYFLTFPYTQPNFINDTNQKAYVNNFPANWDGTDEDYRQCLLDLLSSISVFLYNLRVQLTLIQSPNYSKELKDIADKLQNSGSSDYPPIIIKEDTAEPWRAV